MSAPVQLALDGCVPPSLAPPPAHAESAGRGRAEDFESWVEAVRPAFARAAATGLPFTSYQVARAEGLPEPPDTAHHWGRLVGMLRDEGLIVQAGWDNSSRASSHGSGVKTWRGTRAARRGGAA